MPNYLNVIEHCFPGTEAYTAGNPTVYEDIIWVSAPIDQATLDASDCAQNPGNYVPPDPVSAVVDTVTDGDVITYDSETGQFVAAPPSIVGSVFNIQFAYESSNVRNKWLSYSGGNSFTSNSVPCIIPFDCQLLGMMFSNSDDGCDVDVEVYKAVALNGAIDTNILTWELRASRVGYKTDFANVNFSAGDKIGVFFRDRGGNPDYPIITMILKVSSSNTGEATENFSDYL